MQFTIKKDLTHTDTDTHTHRHTQTYIYIYIKRDENPESKAFISF